MRDVRRASASDVASILAVQDSALEKGAVAAYTDEQLASVRPDSTTESQYIELLANDAFTVLVAVDDGVVGVGTVHTGGGQIHGLYVQPTRADSGTGTVLLERLEERCERAGRTDLVALSTLNAAGFYVRRGYERVGEETVGSDPAIPVVRVEKTL